MVKIRRIWISIKKDTGSLLAGTKSGILLFYLNLVKFRYRRLLHWFTEAGKGAGCPVPLAGSGRACHCTLLL